MCPYAAHWIQEADEMWFPQSLLSNSPQHLRENRAAWEKRKWARDCIFDGGIHYIVSVNGILFNVCVCVNLFLRDYFGNSCFKMQSISE